MLGPEGMLVQEASSNPAGKATKVCILDMAYILFIARVVGLRVSDPPVSTPPGSFVRKDSNPPRFDNSTNNWAQAWTQPVRGG